MPFEKKSIDKVFYHIFTINDINIFTIDILKNLVYNKIILFKGV